jgi:glycosyltransferase involved in cell wall biosynthesis
MSTRKKIVLQTNAPWQKTGLGENGRYLMKHLLRTGKYEVVYYCTSGVLASDPNLSRLPCKAYGAIPVDQNIINELNRGGAREVAYGSYFIDQIIRDEKPDIWWESDDIWSTPGYADKPWFKHVHAVLHKTPDSRPILEEAFKQAHATPLFTTWSKFAADEMKRVDPKLTHVRHIYGMADTTHFSPISRAEKQDLRRRFGIDERALIFHTTNRNQLRKCFVQQIEAFAEFKRRHPKVNAKIHFHTAFHEKGSGWDLPRLAAFHGLKPEDLLSTYVCRQCGGWHITPYKGDFVDCQFCGAKGEAPVNGVHDGRGQMTPNPSLGVPDEEMRLMHGVADAGLSIFDSGGLERFSISSLLCGLPTAISSYSCGEDFMHLPFVFPVQWLPYYQPGTSFMKATPRVDSLVEFMEKVAAMTERERTQITEQGRDWAVKTFSVETIGAQWEQLFDSLPPKDWSSVTLTPKPKNDKAPMPQIADPEQWIRALYKDILNCTPDPDGLKNWMASLDRGTPRDAIYQYFLGEAVKDNAKNAPPQDFGTLFDGNTNDPARRKRLLFVVKESGGDIFIATALLPGLKRLYPDHDLYFACEPKFAEILAGNPHIHRVLPYHPAMEAELQMAQYVDAYVYPAVQTQRQLGYLYRQCGLDLAAFKPEVLTT